MTISGVNHGKIKGHKYSLKKFIKKYKKADIEIVDETYGYNQSKFSGYLGLAVALHALFDVPAALFQCGVLHSTWLVEALLLVLCLGCTAYAKKQYCALQEPEQQTLSDKEES